MLQVEDAVLTVTARNDDPEVEIVERLGAPIQPGIHREIEVPSGASGIIAGDVMVRISDLRAGGNLVMRSSVGIHRGWSDVVALPVMDLHPELDVGLVVDRNVVIRRQIAVPEKHFVIARIAIRRQPVNVDQNVGFSIKLKTLSVFKQSYPTIISSG